MTRQYFTTAWRIGQAGLLGATLSGCGQVHLGNQGINDQAPQAPIVRQGAFTSLNGRTVTGNAIIYNLSNNNYTLRLSGLSAPNENALQVIVVVNGLSAETFALRAATGNQNYSFSYSGTGSPSFDQVKIHNPSLTIDYGEALLVSP